MLWARLQYRSGRDESLRKRSYRGNREWEAKDDTCVQDFRGDRILSLLPSERTTMDNGRRDGTDTEDRGVSTAESIHAIAYRFAVNLYPCARASTILSLPCPGFTR